MRIFLDENLSEYVAEALNLLSKDYFPDIEVVSTKIEIGKSATDEVIIPFVGKEKGALLTLDKGIAQSQVHYQLCKENRVAVISIRLEKGSKRYWDVIKFLIKHWEKIIENVRTHNPPYIVRVGRNYVKRLAD
jgi:hypothetical protein